MVVQLAVLAGSVVPVFTSGEDGWHTYRIPSLIKAGRTLLAICEARNGLASDSEGNALVSKTSQDGGRTWSPLRIVWRDANGGSANNPTALLNRKGEILLHFQIYPKGVDEWSVTPGYSGPKAVLSRQIVSRDGGRSWLAPTDITAQVKRSDAVTLASGPGIGIRLTHGPHRGRLVVPYNDRIGSQWSNYCAFSDDYGASWNLGEPVPACPGLQPNEVQVAELGDGSVVLNARNQAALKFRLGALSRDGGKTFSQAVPISYLPDPTCQGSLLSLSGQSLLFSNPANSRARTNGALNFSSNGGATWKHLLALAPGSFQYSCLSRISKTDVGILYEVMEDGRYRILFQNVRDPQGWRPTHAAKRSIQGLGAD